MTKITLWRHWRNTLFYKKIYFFKALLQIILATLILRSSVSITVSWISVISIVCLVLTFPWTWLQIEKITQYLYPNHVEFDLSINPFKGKTGSGYMTAKKEKEIDVAVSNIVLYDGSQTSSLKNFEKIKEQTECIFAKRSKLWGSPDYDEYISLEENIKRLVPTFYKFTLAFIDLNLDGFLIELPGKAFGENIEVFGDAVRRVLMTLRKADLDHKKQKLFTTPTEPELLKYKLSYLVENPKSWNRRNWVFEFNKVTFFITSFAPFYPETNSRYAFGCENCYILFQPEISFAIHDLPADTAETNWNKPITVRDKIRIAFRQAGREYEVPLKLQEPMVYDIVKRIYPHDDQLEWWLPDKSQNKRNS